VKSPKDIVRDGYDRISFTYRDDAGRGPSTDEYRRPDYEAWLAELMPLLHEGDAVLDLGCGCGVPATALLAEHYSVTGVDLSPVQIERAHRLVPSATFQCADMSEVDFLPGAFTAVVSFFALIHVPVGEQRALLGRIHRWLKPGGYFLATVGSRAWTGTDQDWHGAPMFWSHADQATYVAWLEDSGFAISWTRFIPEGAGGHTLLLAKRLQTKA
jgi:cyclopropane fatty-acyl-phospholipid synthase-like methyltransferase